MTVQSTNTRELTVNEILVNAAKMAGIMPLEMPAQGPQWDARAAFGRDQLKLILDKLPAEGSFVRNIELATVTLIQGTSQYDLPPDTIDVLGDLQYIVNGQSAEVFVRQVDREEYNRYPDKVSQAVPTIVYAQRYATVSLLFLPVPDSGSAGATVRYQRQRWLADTTDTGKNPDVERYWVDHIQHELAARYAFSGGLRDAAKDLRQLAKDFKDDATRKALPEVDNRMVLDHQTGYRAR